MSLSKVYWRSPLIMMGDKLRDDFQNDFTTDFGTFNELKIDDDLKKLLKNYISSHMYAINVLDSERFPRMGRMLLELDSSALFILNRNLVVERDIHKDFKEFTNPETLSSDRYVHSTKTLLDDVNFQRRTNDIPDDPKLKLFEGDTRDYKGLDWIEMDELKKLLSYCSDESEKHWKKNHPFQTLRMDPLISTRDWLKPYPTAFQSVDQHIFTPVVPMSSLIQIGESQIANEDSIVDWLLFGMSSSTSINQSFLSSQNSLTAQSFNILRSVREIADEFHDDKTDTESGVDTEDDNDNFLGNIPHVEIEREIKSQRTNEEQAEVEDPPHVSEIVANGTLNSSFSDNLNLSVFAELEEKLEVPVADKTDERIFELTQKSQITTRETFSMTEDSIHRSHTIIDTLPKVNNHSTEFFIVDQLSPNERFYEYSIDPPEFESHGAMLNSFEDYQMLKHEYESPFYSNRDSVSETPFYFAGKKFQLEVKDEQGIPKYEPLAGLDVLNDNIDDVPNSIHSLWFYKEEPPGYDEVSKWCAEFPSTNPVSRSQLLKSQIEMATQKMRGFMYPSLQTPVFRKRTNYNKLMLLNIEIHVNTRGDKYPDPVWDEISAIFWSFDQDALVNELDFSSEGIFLLDHDDVCRKKWQNLTSVPVEVFGSERQMLGELVGLVELIDPDILSGYEVHNGSWGYIAERCKKMYNVDFLSRISRVVTKHNNKFGDRWGYTHASAIKLTGRHMLNIWRKMQSDTKLNKYSLENVVYHILHQRIPHFDFPTLRNWFTSNDARENSLLLGYYTNRMNYEMKLINQMELVERITEESRLIEFCVDFSI
ncbi:unnamed protein product [Ambrosiozyma monospora]|uniref:Unnamed protein product n=1 Tax=Ambrosiozyma monospora TaxID=43982 RepID=A0ACB5T077_AMBMO|nr:unnamed protein product [Ambrosiozyma monospora]